ncbi:MAG: hypothetical protein ACI8UX_001493 [Psychromonas sp.]|jgi:hypothetical protein
MLTESLKQIKLFLNSISRSIPLDLWISQFYNNYDFKLLDFYLTNHQKYLYLVRKDSDFVEIIIDELAYFENCKTRFLEIHKDVAEHNSKTNYLVMMFSLNMESKSMVREDLEESLTEVTTVANTLRNFELAEQLESLQGSKLDIFPFQLLVRHSRSLQSLLSDI